MDNGRELSSLGTLSYAWDQKGGDVKSNVKEGLKYKRYYGIKDKRLGV